MRAAAIVDAIKLQTAWIVFITGELHMSKTRGQSTAARVTAAATNGRVLVHSVANRASLKSLTASDIISGKSEYSCPECSTRIVASAHAAPHCTSCGCVDTKKVKATAVVAASTGLISIECNHCNSVHTMEPGVIQASGYKVHCAVCGEESNYTSRAAQVTAAIAASKASAEESEKEDTPEEEGKEAETPEAAEEDEGDLAAELDADLGSEEKDASEQPEVVEVDDAEEVQSASGSDEEVLSSNDPEEDATAAAEDGWPFAAEASTEDEDEVTVEEVSAASDESEDASVVAEGDEFDDEIDLDAASDLIELDDLDSPVSAHSELYSNGKEPVSNEAPNMIDNNTNDPTPSYGELSSGQQDDGMFLASDADEYPANDYELPESEEGDDLADVLSMSDTPEGLTLQAAAGRVVAMKGHVVFASLKKENAGKNADVMMTSGFFAAVKHLAAKEGMRKALASVGFKPVRIQTLTAAAVHRKVEKALTAATDSSQRKFAAMSESLAISAAGLARGGWKGKTNPLQAAFVEELRAVGVQSPERVVRRVLSANLVPFTEVLLEVAAGLNSMSPAARLEAARLFEMTQVTSSTEDESVEDLPGIEGRLAATAAVLPSVLTTESPSVGRRDRYSQDLHASATATALEILDGRAPLNLG